MHQPLTDCAPLFGSIFRSRDIDLRKDFKAAPFGCDDPDHAPSDGPNMLPLGALEPLIRRAVAVWEARR